MRIWMEWPQEDFPRTSTQKPKRNLIANTVRSILLEKSPRLNVETWGTQTSPLRDLISQVSGRVVPALRAAESLDDLGLSSLDRVELMSALEDRYQVDLSEARFNAVRTVGDLEGMLRGETTPGAAYHYPSWTHRWPVTWVRLLAHYLLLRPAVFLLGWPRIVGRENLRGIHGPLLVISNHIDDVDPGFILTALPARFRHHLAMGAGGEALESLRTPAPDRGLFARIYDRLRWFLGVSLLNLFPLPREAGFRRSFAYAGEAVDRGYSVLVFPEGRHTTTGEMNPFRSGIGLLAENLGIPVLPMRIDGLYEIKQAGKKCAAPHKISVHIGKPIRFEHGAAPEQIATRLWDAVKAL
jgi:long-chain acyl-CoA synthetase